MGFPPSGTESDWKTGLLNDTLEVREAFDAFYKGPCPQVPYETAIRLFYEQRARDARHRKNGRPESAMSWSVGDILAITGLPAGVDRKALKADMENPSGLRSGWEPDWHEFKDQLPDRTDEVRWFLFRRLRESKRFEAIMGDLYEVEQAASSLSKTLARTAAGGSLRTGGNCNGAARPAKSATRNGGRGKTPDGGPRAGLRNPGRLSRARAAGRPSLSTGKGCRNAARSARRSAMSRSRTLGASGGAPIRPRRGTITRTASGRRSVPIASGWPSGSARGAAVASIGG